MPLSGYEEARATVTFPLKVPSFVPSGLTLGSMTRFYPELPSPALDPSTGREYVRARYSGQGEYIGKYIEFTQGAQYSWVMGLPNPNIVPPEAERGEVDIQGATAQWLKGRSIRTGAQPVVPPEKDPNVRWVPDIITIVWTSGSVKYRIEGLGVTLEDLVAFANSLQ